MNMVLRVIYTYIKNVQLLENGVMGRSLMTLMVSAFGGFGLYTEINEPLPANYIKKNPIVVYTVRGKELVSDYLTIKIV